MSTHAQRGIRPAHRVTRGLQAGLLCAVVIAAVLAGSSAGLAAHSKTAFLYWDNYGVSGTGGTIGRANLNGSAVTQSLINLQAWNGVKEAASTLDALPGVAVSVFSARLASSCTAASSIGRTRGSTPTALAPRSVARSSTGRA